MTSTDTSTAKRPYTLANIRRYASFSQDGQGGNPAGVMISASLPPEAEMQRLAHEVGYSETVFATNEDGIWRVRYFSPQAEVPFCGHATIALGAALAETVGVGTFPLRLNDGDISVDAATDDGGTLVALHSPSTRSRPATDETISDMLSLFSFNESDLDPRIPPAIAEAGATHLILALKSREKLAAMDYDLEHGRNIMLKWKLGTICLVHATSNTDFAVRNAFASHGVFEDPATGAAAAAFAGYLRDLDWPHEGRIIVHQGNEMGVPSRICAEICQPFGSSIRVSGYVRPI